MGKAWKKLTTYASTTLAIARFERLNPLVVAWRVGVAYARYGIDISVFSYARLARVAPGPAYHEFISQGELIPLQFRLNTDDTKPIVKDKLRFHEMCVANGIPSPAIHACITADPELELHGVAPVRTGAELAAAVGAHTGERLLLKPHYGIFGRGVYRIRLADGRVTHDDGSTETADAFVERVLAEGNPYLVQECLEPHDGLRPVMPTGALGTFRIVTVFRDGEPAIVGASLKVPRGESVADNFQKGTTGNMITGVDVDAGTLGPLIAPRPEDPRVPIDLEDHPDSGVRVAGFRIPEWQALCDMVLDAAKHLPGLYTGGWDVAVTTRGPVVIEANWRYGIFIVQVGNRRGVRSELIPDLQRALAERS